MTNATTPWFDRAQLIDEAEWAAFGRRLDELADLEAVR
jgi:hypothetical protein